MATTKASPEATRARNAGRIRAFNGYLLPYCSVVSIGVMWCSVKLVFLLKKILVRIHFKSHS